MMWRLVACLGCLVLCACSFDVPTGRIGLGSRGPAAEHAPGNAGTTPATTPVTTPREDAAPSSPPPTTVMDAGVVASDAASADAAIGMACDSSVAALLPAPGRYRGTIHTCLEGSTPLELPTPDGGTLFANVALDVDLDPNAPAQQGSLNALWSLGGVIGFQLTWRGTIDCRTGAVSGVYEGDWGVPQTGSDLDQPMLLLQGGRSMGQIRFRRAGDAAAIEGMINLQSFAGTDTTMDAATSWCNGQLNAVRDP